MRRNAAFGRWTEEETNWSQNDTEFLKMTESNSRETVLTSLEQLKELHESLKY